MGGLSSEDRMAGKADEEVAGEAPAAASASLPETGLTSGRKRALLLVALVLVGGVAALVAVLVTRNNGGGDKADGLSLSTSEGGSDGGNEVPSSDEEISSAATARPTPASASPTPGPARTSASPAPVQVEPAQEELYSVLVERTCEYRVRQTLPVLAPGYDPVNGTAVEKKLAGGSSAYDGSNAVIVAYNSEGTEGALWVLGNVDGPEIGPWEQAAVVQTSNPDQLGWDVAVGGGALVAGAPGSGGRDVPLIEGWYWAGRGEALIMAKNESGGWVQEAVLRPEVADDNADFGTSVDIAECGCLIAVGAWHDRDSRGSVYIFSKDPSTGEWAEMQKLAPPDARRSQSQHFHGNYGYSVAISDQYLAVKAPYDSYTGSYDYQDPNRGVVYVYRRGPDGAFEQVDRLRAPEGTQARAHGKQLLFLDGLLLVGAPGRNMVYAFSSGGDERGGYRKTAELMPSDDLGPDASFGMSLHGSGASVLVGDRGGGVSYLFSFDDGTWMERAKFNGYNTASSGDSIVEHSPYAFELGEEGYGGEVNFYDLVC